MEMPISRNLFDSIANNIFDALEAAGVEILEDPMTGEPIMLEEISGAAWLELEEDVRLRRL